MIKPPLDLSLPRAHCVARPQPLERALGAWSPNKCLRNACAEKARRARPCSGIETAGPAQHHDATTASARAEGEVPLGGARRLLQRASLMTTTRSHQHPCGNLCSIRPSPIDLSLDIVATHSIPCPDRRAPTSDLLGASLGAINDAQASPQQKGNSTLRDGVRFHATRRKIPGRWRATLPGAGPNQSFKLLWQTWGLRRFGAQAPATAWAGDARCAVTNPACRAGGGMGTPPRKHRAHACERATAERAPSRCGLSALPGHEGWPGSVVGLPTVGGKAWLNADGPLPKH